jgi:hypothetical protein
MIKKLDSIIEDRIFAHQTEILELSYHLEYIIFPKDIKIQILKIETFHQIKEITIGINSIYFLYTHIYNPIILSSITRYYYTLYKIRLIKVALSH